jgi:PAS domain S-box-containing protein
VSLTVAAVVVLMVIYVLVLRQRAVVAAEESARRLRLAFATTGTVGWDRDLRTGVITTTTGDAARDQTQTVEEFLAGVHPEDRGFAEAAVEQAAHGVVEYDVEFRLVAGGGERWMASRAGVLRDGEGKALRLVGVCTDITARKLDQWRQEALARAEQSRALAEAGADRYRRLADELRASTERYRALVAASSEIVFRASADGHEFVAPRWCDITGQGVDELAQGGWTRALEEKDRAPAIERWAEGMAAHAPFESEYRLRLRDGTVRWMHMRAVPLLAADGMTREWVGAISDVDDRRRTHDVLVAAQAELAERVTARTQELEEANLVLRAMIAQRVHADAALRASEARFRAATEGGLDSFYLFKTVRAGPARRGRIADFEFVDCNARGAALAGTSRDQLVGRRLCELFPSYLTQGLFDRYVQVAETGRALEEELEVAEPGSKARWLRVQVVPVNDGVAVTSRDISERRQVESALMESERRFRDLLGNVRLVAVALDTAGRVTFCNAALLELTGLERDALMGADWFDICGADNADEVRAVFQGAVPTGDLPSHFENTVRARDGGLRLIAWDNTLLRDAAGQVIGTASLGADITDQKRYERGLRESKAAAEVARLRAEDASRAKSEFLARMSHELRTPLNSVIGFSTVMLRNAGKTLSAQDIMCTERINASGRHLLGVINDILDIAKVEAGRMTLDIAPVSVGALIRATVEQLEATLADRDVTLALEIPEEESGVSTDAAKLQQVLFNLVGNALKFTERGTITVRVATDPGTHRPTRIDVADTGVGIPAERLGAIFDAFEQADTSTTRRFGGTGLGLAISRSLCELLGYEMRVESAVGEGSTFSVLLDAA